MKFLKAIAILLLAAIPSFASVPNVQGRFEFVTLSGDSPTQISEMGQSSISTYLLQNGNTITNIPSITTDTLLDDGFSYNNDIASGTVNSSGKVTLTFTITNLDKSKIVLVYTGTLGTYSSHGADATVINGTYTSTGRYTTGGSFVATFFPDFTGVTYSGSLDSPDVAGSGGPSEVPASFSILTNADHSVTISNFQVSAPLKSCFVPPFHTINSPDFPLFFTNASGVGLSVYLQDSVGNHIWLNAYSTLQDGENSAALDELFDGSSYPNSQLGNVGTNNLIYVSYGITSNNSCNGYGGGDTPFHVESKKHGKRHELKRNR